VMCDSIDDLTTEGAPAVLRRDRSRHVVAWRGDEIDLPAARDELGEVAAMSVDAGRTRRRGMLVDAEKSPGTYYMFRPEPLVRVIAQQNRLLGLGL